MPLLILSGGQTGADQAAWRAARAAGLDTGGAMPNGFRTELGPRPEFATLYNARELDSPEEAARTVANVRAAEATLVFLLPQSGPGTLLTLEACQAAGTPVLTLDLGGLDPGDEDAAKGVADWIVAHAAAVLNVAGDRESVRPGLGAHVEAFLTRVFRRLGPS